MANELLWWQKEIIYQIYPRSFKDHNHDGIGDFQGILSQLGYLQWLGIKVLWISPFYASPMVDFGYDVLDHKGIHPDYGTMDDFDQLIKEVHQRGMKLILDFIPNHTSDQHPWFQESKSSRSNPKREWYLWRDAKEDGSEPNNWLSSFGNSAWEWDEKTQQYYYHAFAKQQPDLNWRHPEVQTAMADVMRFWLEKGVDGLRIDAIWHLIKDSQFRNNPKAPEVKPEAGPMSTLTKAYTSNQPEIQELMHTLRKVSNEYNQRVLIGEAYLDYYQTRVFLGQSPKDGVHLMFNFLLIMEDWKALQLASSIAEYDLSLPLHNWPNWVHGNHDMPRIADRLGPEQAKIAAILLFTLRGTATMYYGEEIGMRGVSIPSEKVMDKASHGQDGKFGRDPMRTPMQWDATAHAGFSSSTPWLPIDRRNALLNVEVQKKDKNSFLHFYKKLIYLRQSEPSLFKGDYYPVHADHQLLSYIRRNGNDQAFLVVLNLTHRPCYFKPPTGTFKGKIVIATYTDLEGQEFTNDFNLSGDEGLVIQLD